MNGAVAEQSTEKFLIGTRFFVIEPYITDTLLLGQAKSQREGGDTRRVTLPELVDH